MMSSKPTQIIFIHKMISIYSVVAVTLINLSFRTILSRFGEGYMVVIRVKGDLPNLQPVMSYFKTKFPEAVLKVSGLFKSIP